MRAGLAPAMTLSVNQAEGATPMGPLDFYPWHNKQEPETREELEARIKRELLGDR